MRHTDAEVVGAVENPKCLGIRRGNYRSRWVFEAEQLGGQPMGDVPRVWSLFDVCGRNFQTSLRHGAPKAGAAIHTGIESVGVDAWVADESDPAVAQLNKMLCSQVAPRNIVNVGMR